MECLETLGQKYEREREEAERKLVIADQRIAAANKRRHELDTALLKARQEKNILWTQKVEAEQKLVEQELRQAQAERETQLANLQAAAEKETMMKRAIGYTAGGVAV